MPTRASLSKASGFHSAKNRRPPVKTGKRAKVAKPTEGESECPRMYNPLNIFRAHQQELEKKQYANKPSVEPYKNYAPTEDTEIFTRTDGMLVDETSWRGTDTNPYQVINTDSSGEIPMGDAPNNYQSNSSAADASIHHLESPILTLTANRKRQPKVKWNLPNTGPTEILSPKRVHHSFAVITKQKPFEWQPVNAEEWHIYTEVIHSNESSLSISTAEPISKSAEAVNDSSIQPTHGIISDQVTEDIDCAETTNQMESANSSDITAYSETIEACEPTNSSEPINLSDAINTLTPTDICEPIDTLNPTDMCEPIDALNPTDICSPIQSVEQVNFPELISAAEIDDLLQPANSSTPASIPASTNLSNPPRNAPPPTAIAEGHPAAGAPPAPLRYAATLARCAIRRNAFQRLALALHETRAAPHAYAVHARLTATGGAPTERRVFPRAGCEAVGPEARRAALQVWCAAWRRFTGGEWARGEGDGGEGEGGVVEDGVWGGLPSAEECVEWPFVDCSAVAAGVCAPVAKVVTIVS